MNTLTPRQRIVANAMAALITIATPMTLASARESDMQQPGQTSMSPRDCERLKSSLVGERRNLVLEIRNDRNTLRDRKAEIANKILGIADQEHAIRRLEKQIEKKTKKADALTRRINKLPC